MRWACLRCACHQSHWSWVAEDPPGRLYTSNFDDVDHLIRYQVVWAHLDATDVLVLSTSVNGRVQIGE